MRRTKKHGSASVMCASASADRKQQTKTVLAAKESGGTLAKIGRGAAIVTRLFMV